MVNWSLLTSPWRSSMATLCPWFQSPFQLPERVESGGGAVRIWR